MIKLGEPLGTKIRELISIVCPRTLCRWLAAEENGTPPEPSSSKGSRRKTPVDVRVVLQMTNENGWSFGRIVGELKKLGTAVGKTTVKDILRAAGHNLGPKRGQGT